MRFGGIFVDLRPVVVGIVASAFKDNEVGRKPCLKVAGQPLLRFEGGASEYAPIVQFKIERLCRERKAVFFDYFKELP